MGRSVSTLAFKRPYRQMGTKGLHHNKT